MCVEKVRKGHNHQKVLVSGHAGRCYLILHFLAAVLSVCVVVGAGSGARCI